jgi:hypothetical protein
MSTLNKNWVKWKAVLDFTGLDLNFCDIDGIHTTDKTKIIIEEKYKWHNPDQEAYYLKKEIDNDKRPAILIMSSNSLDVSDLQEKIIPMRESFVVGTYDNTEGRFADFVFQKTNKLIKLENLIDCKINTILGLWSDYLSTN